MNTPQRQNSMATSYTPGLKVLKRTIFKTKRILPLKGDVHVNVGDDIQPDTIVASTNLPGNVQMVKLSNALNIDPKDVGNVLKLKEGDLVRKGEMIAETEGVFGFFKSSFSSPIDGRIESISLKTGRLIIREKPIPVQIDGYVRGVVDKVIPEEGIVVRSNASLIQGIFGIAGEKKGTIALVSSNPEDELLESQITSDMKGKIIIGGSFVGINAYKTAMKHDVAGIVVGGFNYYDLKEILGYNLGVAITGTENLNTALIVTEGYGKIPMSNSTFSLLKEHNNQVASINGSTQIRAGVIRPEIVIPLKSELKEEKTLAEPNKGISIGSIVRVIRSPFFGKIGEVVSLPTDLQQMESETLVRVAEIKIDDKKLLIPRANLESVETQ